MTVDYNDFPTEIKYLIFNFFKNDIEMLTTVRQLNKQSCDIMDRSYLTFTSSHPVNLSTHLKNFLQEFKNLKNKITRASFFSPVNKLLIYIQNDTTSKPLDDNTLIENVKDLQNVRTKTPHSLTTLLNNISTVLHQKQGDYIKDDNFIKFLSKYLDIFTKLHNCITAQEKRVYFPNIRTRADQDNVLGFLTRFYIEINAINFKLYYLRDSFFMCFFTTLAEFDPFVKSRLNQFIDYHYKTALSYIPKIVEKLRSSKNLDKDLNNIAYVRKRGCNVVLNEENELLNLYKDCGAENIRQLSELPSVSERRVLFKPHDAVMQQIREAIAVDTTPIVRFSAAPR